jgi:hypothetical protein
LSIAGLAFRIALSAASAAESTAVWALDDAVDSVLPGFIVVPDVEGDVP